MHFLLSFPYDREERQVYAAGTENLLDLASRGEQERCKRPASWPTSSDSTTTKGLLPSSEVCFVLVDEDESQVQVLESDDPSPTLLQPCLLRTVLPLPGYKASHLCSLRLSFLGPTAGIEKAGCLKLFLTPGKAPVL